MPTSNPVSHSSDAPGVRALTLELTKGCNLRCGYCYYAQREDAYQPSKRMTVEVAEQSVDLLIREAPPGDTIHLHFFGGEPLLNFPLLQHTVHYGEQKARENGREITFEVTTNGTLFSESVIEFLNEHRIRVGVSFDGPPEIQDVARPLGKGSSYDAAVDGIRTLLESRRGTDLETHCSVVVTKRDIGLSRIGNHLEELGFDKIILTPATDLDGETVGLSEADLPEVLDAYTMLAADYERRMENGESVAVTWFPILMGRFLSGERKTQFCSGGRDYLGVAADGQVNLCYRFYENDEFNMGSVQEGIQRDVTTRLEEHPVDSRPTCSQCWARHFCGGGCHHDNVIASGGLGEPNPITCDIFRHSMGQVLETWTRLSRKGILGGRKSPAAAEKLGGGIAMNATSKPFTLEDRPERRGSCHVRELDNEKVVYEPNSHEVVVLNETAAWVFEQCDGTHRVADLLESMKRRYDAPEDTLKSDLLRTLRDLEAKQLFVARS